jgi:hypothetical protein
MATRALLLAAALHTARAKVVTGEAVLTGEVTEHEIVKFAFRVGKGGAALAVWTEEGDGYASDELKAYAYLDDDWAAVLKATTCDEKVKLARWSAPVDLRRDNKLDTQWNGWHPPTGSRFWAHRRAMTSSIRTHVWYFTIADCSLERYLHNVPTVHYRAELLDGESHLPVDEAGLGGLHLFNVLVALALVYFVGKRVLLGAAGLSKKNGGDRNVHAAEVLLMTAAICDALSSFFELRHLSAYASNGTGSHAADALSAYFEAMCDALLAALTLTIAAGWTLASRLGDDEKAGRGPLRDETNAEKVASAVAPLARLLRAPASLEVSAGLLGWVTLHLVLAQWSRWEGDDFDSFHDFEHWPGKVIVLLRLGLFLVFVPVALRTQACAGAKLRSFYVGWAAVGGLWILALPLVTLIASGLPAYTRHRTVQWVCSLVQTVALVLYALLFAGRASSSFKEASSVGDGSTNLDFGSIQPRRGLKLRFGGVKVRVD